jgi:acetyl esterase/lipase
LPLTVLLGSKREFAEVEAKPVATGAVATQLRPAAGRPGFSRKCSRRAQADFAHGIRLASGDGRFKCPRTVRIVVIMAALFAGVALSGGRRSALRASEPEAGNGFTLADTERKLRAEFPQIARVSDELSAGVIACENVEYARPGAATLRLDVYRPAGEGPFPAVLIVHGGGWESGDRLMERPLAKRLATLGYVAVPVDYRLGLEGRFPAALDDLKTAVRWLRTHADDHRIERRRIAAVGGSAGGHLAALLGASNGIAELDGGTGDRTVSSAVQAVVDIDGLADFTASDFVAMQAAEPGAPTRFLGGPWQARREIWRQASPLTHVSSRSAPTLFLNSTASRPVLPGRQAMRDKLRAAGVAAEIVTIPGTPHTFWLFHPWFERAVAEIDRFLRRQFRNGG